MPNVYLQEKVGNPELFTGRKKELSFLLDWVDRIKLEASKSTALLSRRKTGKSSLMLRLYNILFEKSDGVIPFYYEVQETSQWIGKFAEDFFLTFISQYVAYKTQNKEYISGQSLSTELLEIIEKEGLTYLSKWIHRGQELIKEKKYDMLWDLAREAPRHIATSQNESVVQMIDEFQFLNEYIYWDESKTNKAVDFVGSYIHTCEYKNAPLLVSGSWVGWLIDDINKLLPARFVYIPLGGLTEEESVEMIFKYSMRYRLPVNDETAYLMAQLTEGSPFYISSLFDSPYMEKDFTTKQGVLQALEFETLNYNGIINSTWMEYIDRAFSKINEVNAKRMVIYLSKHRDRPVGHSEIRNELKLDMTDIALEKKLKALYRTDIIEVDQGLYSGVKDNIFDKVFRRSYSDDIQKFVTEESRQEYQALLDNWEEKYKHLEGEFNLYKGKFAEFMIWSHLEYAFKNPERYKKLFNGLPNDFSFVEYSRLISYSSPPLHSVAFQIDVFTVPKINKITDYHMIGEVKDRGKKNLFSLKEAQEFVDKANELIKIEQVQKAVLFVASFGGFRRNVVPFFKKNKIAWSTDKRWFDKPN